jgi:two-component SAPR family response regulator
MPRFENGLEIVSRIQNISNRIKNIRFSAGNNLKSIKIVVFLRTDINWLIKPVTRCAIDGTSLMVIALQCAQVKLKQKS